ncbi:alpha-amylase family glycosyl hydrolase, partial [Halobacillus trueperi]|uniref:alpha-amylase family glycosyl hydrolase n=1 Tax=Halobacillus trueperi TaxID=156205 RepID=UPI002163AAE9
HLDLWDQDAEQQLDIPGLKKVLTRWQKALEGDGWNALFVENHDKARVVSTWGDDEVYWRESATSIATMYFFMQGTPYIYQGQEIGMTNMAFPSIEDYDDVAAKNLYKAKKEQGMSHDEIMQILWNTSRDNSRTPMQWSHEENAGFTSGTPWMKINPNYKAINVTDQQDDPHSILNHYKEMIRLKKQHDLFTYGTYELILPEDKQIYAYTRTLGDKTALVITNLTKNTAAFTSSYTLNSEDLILSNLIVDKHVDVKSFTLKPFEARVYLLNQ